MESLKNLHHNIYEGKQFTYKIFSIQDCSAKKKEYEPYQGNQIPKEIPNLGYINIQIGKYPIMITTPTMVCPFGFNKSTGQLPLQFTNVKTDPEMNSFFNFIQRFEFEQMKYLGLTDEDSELYISQIKFDKKERYDPNLSVKVPFYGNRYDVDIYSEDSNNSLTRIYNFSKVKCDIYVDKIWKFNDHFICKWKVKRVVIL
jgi:hypothetical protein